MILYEYPFNERIRTYLRLEQLFFRLGELIPGESTLNHHYVIATLFEVMDVASRADLKAELVRDLERQKQVMQGFQGNPAVAEEVLLNVLAHFDKCLDGLRNQGTRIGQPLAENEWLMNIRSRISIPGGTCSFDLPAYYAWQQADAESRREDLLRWSQVFHPLADSVSLLLRILRDSGPAQKVLAPAGQYRQSLPAGRTFQLLRLEIDRSLRLVPEISGNRLVVSIRFLLQDKTGRAHATQQDTTFTLTLCSWG